ncbi:MAG: hypothetical protein ACEQSA_00715 [Weeksellaceae bacterium]
MKFIYKDSALIPDASIQKEAQTLAQYVKHMAEVAAKTEYTDLEASLLLSSDAALLQKVKDIYNKKHTINLKYIFVVGIGGSNLGTKAIYDALLGFYDNLRPGYFPKIIFLDTQITAYLTQIPALLETLSSKEEIFVHAISKSGGTTETIANLTMLTSMLEKRFGEVNDRMVIITDEGSAFQKRGEELGIDILTMPKTVGGRFSVFSAVGLLALMQSGVDVVELRRGATDMRNRCLQADYTENPAMISAIVAFLHNQQGKNIHDTFVFTPQLESLGKWYRQLLGESAGKEGKGITPTVSVGSVDLHSVAQLYLGGPKDKITTFVYTQADNSLVLEDSSRYPLVPNIEGKSIDQITHAIIGGTKAAYLKAGLPYMECVLEKLTAYELGAFLQFKMCEMMYLGKLMEVNTFDQPEVELYKMETKKLLSL